MKLPKLKITDKHFVAPKRCVHGHPPYRYKTGNQVCIYCMWIKVRKWRDKNPGHMSIRNKAYYHNNLEYEIARRNKRAKDFPEERLAINRNRRARKRAAKGHHTRADILRLFDKQDGICVGLECGNPLLRYHVDHKTPLIRGGSNWPRNLQLLCPPCNDAKGVMTMQEWRGQKVLLDRVFKACFKRS